MPSYKPIKGVHTTVTDRDNVVTVRYHNTIVFMLDRVNHRLTINDGGFRTFTTKKRLNQAFRYYKINVSVFQRNFDWYISYMDGLEVREVELVDQKTVIALCDDNCNVDCIDPNW